MAGLVFLLLPISVLAVFALIAVAFADVAFGQVAADPVGAWPASDPLRDFAGTLQNLMGTGAAPVACGCDSFVPSVTEPEARSIVAELRQRGSVDLPLVMERSKHPDGGCPMLMASGVCACAMTRPLACIGRCVVGGDSPEWATGLGDSLSTAFRRHLESQHVNAESRRLDEALAAVFDAPTA